MLKRLYIHNYNSLVNFEIFFDKDFALFLGGNGSGKTSVFNALNEIQRFVLSNVKLNDKKIDEKDRVFKSSTLTRWNNDPLQKFEMDIEGNGGIYRYSLEIEHELGRDLSRVKTEALSFDSQSLYRFEIEEVEKMQVGKGWLFNDLPSKEGIFYPADWFGSGLATVQERHDNKKLFWFKRWLERLFVAHITPSSIKFDMEQDEKHPELDLSNYVAWLNYFNNENREGMNLVESELRQIVGGFTSFKFSQYGVKKILEAKINNKFYRFDELSDGQKSLAALYTLIYCTPDNALICIDEPENYLALPEIQPWLNTLRDQCRERSLQVILISHHPSLINFLTTNSGYWFFKEDLHTRTKSIAKQDDSGLSLAQLIETGWIYGD